jgi:hypothetical protein
VRGAVICLLTFKNKFFIIALENYISNGGFALNYFKQIYLMEQQDIPQETLTFNLTPKSAVLIPKASSEYTGKGTPTKTATFNAKIHIVDATSTSNVSLVITNSSTNPVTIVVENNSTKISENSENKIKIGETVNGRFIKDKIPVKFEYTDPANITIQVCYIPKQSEQQTPQKCIPEEEGIKIELK